MLRQTITSALLALAILVLVSCESRHGTEPGLSQTYYAWWDGIAPDSYEPLVIGVAPLGLELSETEFPTVEFPNNFVEYLNEIENSYDLGATFVHLLPVNIDDIGPLLDWSWENYKSVIDSVTANCPDMLICADITELQDSTWLDTLLNYPTVNFIAPVMGRYLYGGFWSGSDDFNQLQLEVTRYQSANVKVIPSIVSPQQADLLNRALILTTTLTSPYHFAITVGWEANTASEPEVLDAIYATLPSSCEKILVCNVDNASEIMGLAIAEGYHLRVGMKDAVYWPGGTSNPVSSTSYMVQKAVEVAGQLGRTIATPTQARTILGVYR